MSLVATRLQNFRADSPVDKWEVRADQYGALDLFMTQTNSPNGIITEDLKTKAVAAVGSTLEIPVLAAESFSIQNVTQPVVITGDTGVSALYAVTFANYYFGFRMFPAGHFNNEISIQREFNRKLSGFISQMQNSLEAAGLAALEAKKTQVLADTLGGKYTLTANTVVSALATQEEILGDTGLLFKGNKFFGATSIVANNSMESLIRNKLLEKGEFQTNNKTYQWSDKTFHFTNALANGAGNKAAYFAVQADSLGIVQQFSPDCVLGNKTHKHIWDIEMLPIANIPIGIYQYDDALDGTAQNGAASAHLTATKMEAYGFHTAIAFVTPYNSEPSTIASPIMKVVISAT